MRKAIKAITIIVLSVALMPLAFGATAVAALFYWPVPFVLPPEKAAVEGRISRLYDIKGNEIGTFRLFEQNIPVARKDIPLVLKQATIASEDRKFYDHGGVDVAAVVRAGLADITKKKVVQGGSTITQQYVRSVYLNREQTFTRKFREALLATRIENKLTKDEILYRYLTTVYFGDGSYGVGAAAKNFFQKSPKDLTLSESAMLIGLLPAPTAYNPRQSASNAETRRRIVLRNMLDEKMITQKQYKVALKEKIWIETNGPARGPVTIVRAREVEASKYPAFTHYVRSYLSLKYGEDVVKKQGLEIQTTLDPDAQQAAYEAIDRELKGSDIDIEMALTSVEPQTGFVRAMVGSRDEKKFDYNFSLGSCPSQVGGNVPVKPYCWNPDNKVQPVPTGGGSGRQPGSSFKPFVLATAYSQGIKPTAYFPGGPYRISGCRGNYKVCTISSHGAGNLNSAIAVSSNGAFARLIDKVGVENTAEMAKKLGLTAAWYSPSKYPTPARYALGMVETNPLDMASAYGVFANRGIRLTPTPIVKIVTASGKVLEDNTDRKGFRALDANVANNVTRSLEGVIKFGTARGRGNIGRPVAGKTGTNNNHRDAWFVGYTPSLSTAVWIGHKSGQKEVRLPRYGRVFGADAPTSAWAYFMKRALEDIEKTDFDEPAPIVAPVDFQKVIRERKAREARPGVIEPGARRTRESLSGGNFEGGQYIPPTTTTTKPITSSTSTPQ